MAHISRTFWNWHFPMPKWIFFVNALLLWSVTLAKTLQPILWDKNNANFTSNGINITVEINDVIDIQCPQTQNTTAGRLKAQYHKFTQVSEVGFNDCTISSGRKRNLLSCNRPFVENKYTLLFQQYTPYPHGPTFSHGSEYFFITTSNGSESGIGNKDGGLCRSNNMKLRVFVKPKPTEAPTTRNPNTSTTPSPSSTTSASPPSTSKLSTTTPTTASTTVRHSTVTSTMTTLSTTEKSPTSESNKIMNPRGGDAARITVSTTLSLVSWLVAVVRWLHP